MSCESERAALDSANAAADNAKIDSDAAWAKAMNNTEAASAAWRAECGAGVVGGLVGAGVGALGAGVACLAGLYAARNSGIDSEATYKKYQAANSAAARALGKYYTCMERNRGSPGAGP